MTDPLSAVGAGYARTIIDAVRLEYPNHLRHMMNGPDDRPTPREVHPALYGCLDWHSSVEMHWALVRLLRLVPSAVPAAEIRAVLDEHLTSAVLAVEAAYFAERPGFERPYGWGWALMLAAELESWDEAGAWSAAMEPLASRIAELYVDWLPRATYPTRDGAHMNSAFGLARALPYAADRPDLHAAICAAARRWFGEDRDYPAAWKPGGADFLSGALTEAELMAAVLDGDEFASWFAAFLPVLPLSLRTPAVVSDPTDGQIAHLHGLNLYRAFAFTRLEAVLPPDDERRPLLVEAARAHAEAALPVVTGADYLVEHWLAAYAVLYLG
ncbi:MAG: DUF2891 domain-containing protein [Geodermatophilaceae bacterium]|nr:DUF2891 domain-containing protein [Geodermatophilaceae bacterium]